MVADSPNDALTVKIFVFCRYAAIVFATFAHVGCANSPDRMVGYGGEKWSLADIFPEGPNRELAAAAAAGDLSGIDRALKAGANVNFRGAYDLTPLWWAAWDQNLRGFTRLLERGADPNVVPSKNSPLMNNISEAFWPVGFLKAALAHGGDPNMMDRNGRKPLTAAMQQGTREQVDLLLAAGASVNRLPGERGAGPVFAALMARRFDYVLMLLQKGADPNARDLKGGDLAYLIGLFPYDPNSEHYVWRERVIRFLKSKGIEAHPPPNEGKRTKALPADLR
jgi:hypothetical protein